MPHIKPLIIISLSHFLVACNLDNKEASTVKKESNIETEQHEPVKQSQGKNTVVIDKKYYEILYDTNRKGAIKVSYDLNRKKVNKGNIKDRPHFYNEKSLPKQHQTFHSDYTNTGYDRGHLANDASFDSTKASQLSTYSMANIVPMFPTVNRGGWLSIEDYERYLTSQFKDIHVVNIVKYKKGHFLKKKPLDDVLDEKTFKTKKHKINYIKKYKKASAYLEKKKIGMPVGFYKVLSAKAHDFKECFYIKNKTGNDEQDHLKYMIDCKKVPS